MGQSTSEDDGFLPAGREALPRVQTSEKINHFAIGVAAQHMSPRAGARVKNFVSTISGGNKGRDNCSRGSACDPFKLQAHLFRGFKATDMGDAARPAAFKDCEGGSHGID
jgi:hypothetical protein